jgi:hypothetical protein
MFDAATTTIACSVVNTLIVVAMYLRRQPPLDQDVARLEREVSQNHPNRDDFKECASRCRESVKEVKAELESLRADVFSRINRDHDTAGQAIREFESRLGKLEGANHKGPR